MKALAAISNTAASVILQFCYGSSGKVASGCSVHLACASRKPIPASTFKKLEFQIHEMYWKKVQ